MGTGKLTLKCDQGATFRVQARWRQPLIDLASGDPILDFDGNILARVALEQKLLAPGAKSIGPGLDRVEIATWLRRGERAVPAIVRMHLQRFAVPLAVGLSAPEQRSGDDVMSVA